MAAGSHGKVVDLVRPAHTVETRGDTEKFGDIGKQPWLLPRILCMQEALRCSAISMLLARVSLSFLLSHAVGYHLKTHGC